MRYGPFEPAQFYTSGLKGRPGARYASVSDYQRVIFSLTERARLWRTRAFATDPRGWRAKTS